MKWGYVFVSFMLANMVLAVGFLVTKNAGWDLANSKPVPVYGDFVELAGRNITLTEHSATDKIGNTSIMRPMQGHSQPEGDYLNLTFVRSELSFNINFTELADFGIGLFEQVTTHKVFFEDNGRGTVIYQRDSYSLGGQQLQRKLSLTTSQLNWSVWFEKIILPEPGATQSPTQLTSKYANGTGVEETSFYDGSPCFFWTGNGTFKVSYVEVWKYQPVLSYDSSAIEAGQSILATVRQTVWPVVISDCLIVVVLGSAYFSSLAGTRKKDVSEVAEVPKEDRPETCGECRKYDSASFECRVKGARGPEAKACEEGVKN